jgi:hypothetical protein
MDEPLPDPVMELQTWEPTCAAVRHHTEKEDNFLEDPNWPPKVEVDENSLCWEQLVCDAVSNFSANMYRFHKRMVSVEEKLDLLLKNRGVRVPKPKDPVVCED